jgi:hypothetical protein
MAELKKKPTRTTARATKEHKPVRRPTARTKKKVELTHDVIAERAYFIAIERGGGDPFQNWIDAEREVSAR